MRILIIHPLMSVMGGGERLCCETIRVLKERSDELTLLSSSFSPIVVERFFGYKGLFQGIQMRMYKADAGELFGSYKHILHHTRAQQKLLSKNGEPKYDLVFSTQDPGYIPDIQVPVLQWGYFPSSLPKGLYGWPMRTHYSRKIRRIGLLLAISEYSKEAFDRAWKVHTKLVHPACNMIEPSGTRDRVVVTAARAVPEKRLELFWEVAKRCLNYEFILLMTQDPRFLQYSLDLRNMAPANGRVIVNPDKRVYQETLARSRYYLHLMKGEHFGITVVEAMSAGCVPVVHNSGGPKEIVGDCGFLWRTIEEIPTFFGINDSSLELMSERCMRRARVFSREKFVARLGEVLAETFSRSRRRAQ